MVKRSFNLSIFLSDYLYMYIVLLYTSSWLIFMAKYVDHVD